MKQNCLEIIDEIIRRYQATIDAEATIPAQEYERRWAAVQNELRQRNLDAGVFYFYREMPGDGLYLTGYNPTIERACGVIGQIGKPIIIAGPEAGELAREAARASGVEVYYAEEFQIPDEYYAGSVFTPIKDIIARVARFKQINRVGWLTSSHILSEFLVTAARSSIPQAEHVDASDILHELRHEKSDVETRMMATADLIANAAARAMISTSRPGMRENELAAVGDYVMKSLGATSYGFETIVNSGPRCRTIIGPASNRTMQSGEMVQIGVSPGFEGYKGVVRRVFILGQPSDLQASYLAHLETAFALAKSAMGEVVAGNEVPNKIDLAARDYFASIDLAGTRMSDLMTYSCVHGTGLTECMEGKPVTPYTTEPLGHRIGMMLDVGAYGHPNDAIAGGCIEDAFIKDGRTVIEVTDLPSNVQQMVGKWD